MASVTRPHESKVAPRSTVVLGVVIALVAVGLVVAVTRPLLALGAGFSLRTLAIFVIGTGVVVWLARRHLRPGGFGAANSVTLVRAALIAPLVGLLGEVPTAALAWFASTLALVVLALDGIDGHVARRTGSESRFGARFDMETDALLILALSLLCAQFDKAPLWVIAAGLMRYAFVGSGWLLPWMRASLPPSRRRQAVCVVQIVTLLACLSPLLAPPLSAAVAALGLAVLAWSFLVDVVWLARHD